MRKVGKKKNLISKKNFLFYPPTLNIYVWLKKNYIFLRFCLCIFENGTVKSDGPVQIFRKMMKFLKITLLVLLFSGDIKEKKKEKKSSEKKKKKKKL